MADSLAASGRNRQPGTRSAAPGAVTDLAGVVLAAGEGRRLRPLTALRPKPLCPVGDRVLLDRALDQVQAATRTVAVNLHHGRAPIAAHLDAREAMGEGWPVHRSVEEPGALGTAGALGALRSWIDGRDLLVVNADAWSDADLAAFVAGWDRARPRVLVAPGPSGAPGGDGEVRFGPGVGLVASLLPWHEVERLSPQPSGLYELVWRGAHEAGRLDVVAHRGRFVDCGTPLDYLEANLEAIDEAGVTSLVCSGDAGRGAVGVAEGKDVLVGGGRVVRSVVGRGAVVEGRVVESVVWPGSHVGPRETLRRCVRAGHLTVAVR